MSNRIDELKKIIKEAHSELNELQTIRNLETNQKLVGKFFRYNNGYHHDDRWWVYVFVRGLDVVGNPVVDRFETNNDRKTEIELAVIHYYSLDKDYKEITELEFMKSWEDLKRTMNGVKFQI